MKKKVFLLSSFLFCVLLVQGVYAVPKLQLYIDGSVYIGENEDPYISEGWLIDNQNPFTLWIIGALPGSADYIEDVNIFFATNMTGGSGSIIITPLSVNDSDGSLIGVEGTPTTLYFPDDFVYGIPPYGNETLPTHGIYPANYANYSYNDDTRLQRFDKLYLVEDKVEGGTNLGQQYAYSVEVTGKLALNYVHMDAANHIVYVDGKENAVFAPFSHDATYIPEFTTIGSALALLGAGLYALKKRRK